MKNYTFHWEVKDLIIQFIQALDDCIVKRYDENLDVEKEIAVKYVYAPKSRTLHWLVNKQQHIALPAVSVWVGGIARDPSRVFNKIDGPVYMKEDLTNPLQPVPVNINVNVSILTKYQNDMDQIVTNFVPYFDPYIVMSWQHPSLTREIRSEVLWDGNLSYKYPTDLQPTDSYRMSIDTTFTIKGWMFKKADDNSAPIYVIDTNYIPLADLNIPYYDYDDFKDDLVMDSFSISGIPVVKDVNPSWVHREGGDVSLYGTFLSADHVYLSGSDSMLSGELAMSAIDMFSNVPNLSGNNPPFMGVEISTFNLVTDSKLKVSIPELGVSGFLDIIVLNDAGYGGIIRNNKTDQELSGGMMVV